jgi:hypothetical protein
MMLYDCLSGQGTAYIVAAWEAVASAQGVVKECLPITFKDISIRQAVYADIETPVTLAVTLDRSNGFQVMHTGHFNVSTHSLYRVRAAGDRAYKVLQNSCVWCKGKVLLNVKGG